MSETKRPKILLVTRNYPPLTGGMERLMQRASEGLAEWTDLTIVGPEGCSEHAPEGVATREAPAGLLGFLIIGTWAALAACRKDSFDMIIGGSGLVGPILWLLKLCFKKPTAVFIHGLDIVVDNAAYQQLFLPAIRRNDLIIANSRNTRRLAIDRGVPEERIHVINPGTDLPDMASITTRDEFCREHQITFDKIILFTGRISRRKGLYGFIRNSLPAVLKAVDGAGLLVVGENPNQSLNQSGEGGEVRKLVAEMNLESKIKFLGQVDDEALLAAYATSDVQVFPLIEVPGDVEGFGMVAIEAAAVGTPTVAFDLGGVADAISADGPCGRLIPQGDYSAFAMAVTNCLNNESGAPCEDCIAHATGFHWKNFNEALQSSVNKLSVTDRSQAGD